MILDEGRAPERRRRRPVLIEAGELEGPAPHPAEAEAPPESDALAAEETAAARAVTAAARPASWLARLFWSAALGLLTLGVTVAAYDFLAGMVARNPILGATALGLTGIVLLALVVFAIRELAGVARLSRVDALRSGAEAALRDGDVKAARKAAKGLVALYAGRRALDWGRDEVRAREGELLEADAVLAHAERSLLAGLDAEAEAAVGRAARTVAGATALIPLALVDVVAALAVNLSMIRRVAEIYGGRAGWLGSWRLLRAVAGHLVATGAVAIGDDAVGAILGSSVLSRMSRRFGEGLLNGVLTARVGAAAIEVCRPLPFHAREKPTGIGLASRALKGIVAR
jgi:putative membrane protein